MTEPELVERLKANKAGDVLDEFDEAEQLEAATLIQAQTDEIERLTVRAWGTHYTIEHDGFSGTVIGSYITLEGKRGVVLQLDNARVVHVYGEKWLEETPK